MTASPNSINRRVGATAFPYSGSDVQATEGAIVDSVQETLLACFKAAILDEFSDAFATATTAIDSLSGQPVVADTWSGLLTPQVMKQRKPLFPLLSVGWTGQAEWSEYTLGVDHCKRKWLVNYVLGPLDAGPAQRVDKLPHKIAVLLQLVIRNRGHKAFQNGALLWGDDTEGRPASISFDSHEAGQASFAGDESSPLYYGMTANLTTSETDFDLNIYPPLTGATFTVGAGGSDGVIPSEIIAQTEFPVHWS